MGGQEKERKVRVLAGDAGRTVREGGESWGGKQQRRQSLSEERTEGETQRHIKTERQTDRRENGEKEGWRGRHWDKRRNMFFLLPELGEASWKIERGGAMGTEMKPFPLTRHLHTSSALG